MHNTHFTRTFIRVLTVGDIIFSNRMHSVPKHPCRYPAILTVALVACGGVALLIPSAVEADIGASRSLPSSSSGSLGGSSPANGSRDSAPMLRMDFGPAKNVVVNGGKMSGKASNTLDLYPHGFAYSGAGDDVLGVGDRYSLAPYSVDGGNTFRNASFRPTRQQSWTSFAYFNNSGDLWASVQNHP